LLVFYRKQLVVCRPAIVLKVEAQLLVRLLTQLPRHVGDLDLLSGQGLRAGRKSSPPLADGAVAQRLMD
jgi:hypothetical protein